MADVKWIKITTDIFDNRKIKHLRRLPGGNNTVLIWIMLLTMAGRCNSGGRIFLTESIPYTAEILADEMGFKEKTVRDALAALQRMDLVFFDGDFLVIPGWEEHQNIEGLEKIREQNRARKRKQREKETVTPSCDCHVTSRDSHATEEDKKRKEKIREENNHCASQPSPAAVNAFFESVWKLYPIKRGKGQVSKSKRETLYKIGLEELTRAIDRYIMDLQKDESWRKPQNGSTFFNSGYVDYLDANYAGETAPTGTGNRRSEAAAAAIQKLFAEELERSGERG